MHHGASGRFIDTNERVETPDLIELLENKRYSDRRKGAAHSY